jgi:hypothetical protein
VISQVGEPFLPSAAGLVPMMSCVSLEVYSLSFAWIPVSFLATPATVVCMVSPHEVVQIPYWSLRARMVPVVAI